MACDWGAKVIASAFGDLGFDLVAGPLFQPRKKQQAWPWPPIATSDRSPRSPSQASRSWSSSSRCMCRRSPKGVVQGASVAGGMERSGRAGGPQPSPKTAHSWSEGRVQGAQTASDARAGGSRPCGCCTSRYGFIGSAGWAAGSAAKERAIASPGTFAGSLLGLADAKLDQSRHRAGVQPSGRVRRSTTLSEETTRHGLRQPARQPLILPRGRSGTNAMALM